MGQISRFATVKGDRMHCKTNSLGCFVAIGIACTLFFGRNQALALPVSENIQKLVHADAIGNDQAGNSIAVSGNIAVIGVPNAWRSSLTAMDPRGAAYVFRFNGTNWVQEQKLTATDAALGDRFGSSVAVSANSVFVGSSMDDDRGFDSGSVYVFRHNGSSWVQSQKLVASDGAAGDNFGSAVSLDGDSAFVGAMGDSDVAPYAGSAYVFRFNGQSWVQSQKLLPQNVSNAAGFGKSISVSSGYAVIGCYQDDTRGSDAGAAFVYGFNGSSWVQNAKLTALDGGAYQLFGYAVSLSGSRMIIGAPKDDDRGLMSGSAYIFRYNGTSWTQESKLVDMSPQAPSGQPGNQFGYSVGISGSTAVIGSPWWDDQSISYPLQDQGAAYVFSYDAGSMLWTVQTRLVANDGYYFDNMGTSVAVDGDMIGAGAGKDDSIAMDSGSAYIFDVPNTILPPPECVSNADCADDGNSCTSEVCSAGTCTHPAKANGTACGNSGVTDCSLADTCVSGACSPNHKTSGTACTTDNNACTSDVCNSSGNCLHNPLASGSSCGDGLYCNGADTCNATGTCLHAGNPCPGADGDGDCSETCNEAVDACTANDPNGALCNDGNSLTSNDKCTSGVCAGTTAAGCVTSADCNDNNPCTTDSCVSGTCQRSNNTLACDDGLYCNGTDLCSNGACGLHTGNPCPGADGDADCSETCNETANACTSNDPDNSACSDGNSATVGDRCYAGTCLSGTTAPQCTTNADCNDNNVCTTDSCVSGTCQRVNNTLACTDDGNSCTSDVCSAGACTHPAKANGTACADDGNTCTSDVCSAGACTHPAKANGTACNDGQYCNGADTCSAGACSNHAGNPCPGADSDADCSETCNEASDSCTTNDPNGSVCNDGSATTYGDQCTSGACVGTACRRKNQTCTSNSQCCSQGCGSNGRCN